MSPGEKFYFELRFAPSLALVTTVRRFVTDFFGSVLPNPEAIARVAMVVHELLENAVKYSVDGVSEIKVQVDGVPGGANVRITTKNNAQSANVAALEEILTEMRAAADPMDFYVSLMERSVRKAVGSQLGIGRIYAETGMALSCAFEQRALSVSAEGVVR
jgi:hypothetical protein